MRWRRLFQRLMFKLPGIQVISRNIM